MEIKVNDYVRTKKGQIYKITDLKGYYENDKLIEDRQYVYIDNHFSEVGDYVDKLRVVDKYEDYIVVETFDERIVIQKEDTIKSIVTKEMFEQMEYKVGE